MAREVIGLRTGARVAAAATITDLGEIRRLGEPISNPERRTLAAIAGIMTLRAGRAGDRDLRPRNTAARILTRIAAGAPARTVEQSSNQTDSTSPVDMDRRFPTCSSYFSKRWAETSLAG